jgi:pSer/pThr/pTyr-binding forkhead associated (FHA) protein
VLPICRSKKASRLDPLTLGRADTCDIALALPVVSKLHAYLHDVGPESADIEDAGSRNGTFVQGIKLERGQRSRLTDGSLILLGQVVLEFRSASKLAPQVIALGMRHRR